ncbi:unnamed protein product [Zymoseptoria tritici ST99CH_1E4]|uniref:F-box domain-containing protein n=1 Tax=Zymoseptoria tritici ST99CH_1E4 TaxID=1276532 RepID=A0A2H1H816_ZYMTR|nr:unnamed protein product [Zymoseptoria tritici ST99CH_1E4]
MEQYRPFSDDAVPVEVAEHIGRYVDKEDLKSFRLASRTCAAAASKAFKKAYFSELTVMLATESSIALAIKIMSDQKANLGVAVKKLVLVDDSVSEPYGSHSADAEERAAATLFHEQGVTRRNGQDRRLLTDLLRECGKTVHVSGKKSILFRSHHEKTDCNFVSSEYFDYEEWIEDVEDSPEDHVFQTLMLAILSAGIDFGEFSMDVGERQGIQITRYGASFWQGTVCKAALDRFQTLDLVLNADPLDDLGVGRAATDFFALIPKLKIRSLKVTRLLLDDKRLAWPTAATLMAMDFPLMKSLEFEKITLPWSTLVRFLKHHKNLRELILPPEHAGLEGIPDEVSGIYRFPIPWDIVKIVLRELSRLTGIPKVEENELAVAAARAEARRRFLEAAAAMRPRAIDKNARFD